MTKRNSPLWEQGLNCVFLFALAISNTISIFPRSIRHAQTLVIILALFLVVCVDWQKRNSYGEGELERERRDERSRMIQTQAVWYCHVAEDWILLGLFAVFGIFVRNDAVAYAMMWVLAVRALLSFCIRWWLERKY